MWTVIGTVLATLFVVMLVTNLRGPEKQPKQRMKHLFPIADPQLKLEMGTLLGPGILPGNRITALQNGDEIFPAMLEAIRGAQRTITFETYIYWSGSIGEKFAEALVGRVKAGVKVHVMLDWLGSNKLDANILSRLTDAGIEVERYHPLRWYSLGKMNNRTHRKVLVVDGTIAFTGGVGVADQWLGHAQDPDHWRDIHFRVEGPVVAQMQAAFLDNWIKTTGEVLHGDGYFPAVSAAGNQEMHLFTSSPAGGSASMRLMYMTAISAAVQSIDIEAAYFVPDALMSDELIRARERGVRIRILVPDKHSDSATVNVASKRTWGPLLERGVEVYQYEPTMMHNKMLIFDRYVVSVGSTNFDMRSFDLNDEASLNVYDSEFAAQMTASFEDDLKQSTPYALQMWNDRSWAQRFAEVVVVPVKSQL